MDRVAFLGTGLLGSGMVEHALVSGTAITVWNRTPAKARALEAYGAIVANSPRDAVAAAERVHFVLQDDNAVDDVLEQIAPALRSDAIVIDHSTTSLPARSSDSSAHVSAVSASCTRRCSCRPRWRVRVPAS